MERLSRARIYLSSKSSRLDRTKCSFLILRKGNGDTATEGDKFGPIFSGIVTCCATERRLGALRSPTMGSKV